MTTTILRWMRMAGQMRLVRDRIPEPPEGVSGHYSGPLIERKWCSKCEVSEGGNPATCWVCGEPFDDEPVETTVPPQRVAGTGEMR